MKPIEPITALSLCLYLAAIGVFGAGTKVRPRQFVPMAFAGIAACVLSAALLNAVSLSLGFMLTPLGSFVTISACYAALLAVAVVLVRFWLGISVWGSLFLCTSAYAMENLAAGVTELVRLAAVLNGLDVSAGAELAVSVLCTLSVYAACYVLLVRRIHSHGLVEVRDRKMLFVTLAVVLACICLDLGIKLLPYEGVSLDLVCMLRLAHVVVCVFILFAEFETVYNKRLQLEAAATDQLLMARSRQYRLSRETIDAINLKCHDIRHQIRQLEGSGAVVDRSVVEDIAREVDVYDAGIVTGNVALDTILSEKSLVCQRAGISLSCMADGTQLGFLPAAELYAFFGNALENAIDATSAIDDPERRVISLTVRRNGDMVVVHMENSFAGTVEFEDGLPRSTKGDAALHGYGTRSMRQIVEAHNGILSMGTHGQTFYLNALFPAAEIRDRDTEEKGASLAAMSSASAE